MPQSDMPISLGQAVARRGNAQIIVDLIGGPTVAARVCGVKRTQVWRWTSGELRHIPFRHHGTILRYAREKKIDLPSHLFLVDEVDDMTMEE